MNTRGLNGLNTEELRETRRGFWDDAFTEIVLRRIPEGTMTIVDIGCGLANTAPRIAPKALQGDLFARLRRERLPADSAIGPMIAKLFEQKRLSIAEFFPYVVGKTKKQPANQAFKRARQVVRIVSANLPDGASGIAACMSALNKAESFVGSETIGYYCQLPQGWTAQTNLILLDFS